jgi:hypothetical protein
MELRLRSGDATVGLAHQTRFRHDPGALMEALSRHALPPPDLPVGDYTVSVRVTNGELVAEWDAPVSSA